MEAELKYLDLALRQEFNRFGRKGLGGSPGKRKELNIGKLLRIIYSSLDRYANVQHNDNDQRASLAYYIRPGLCKRATKKARPDAKTCTC